MQTDAIGHEGREKPLQHFRARFFMKAVFRIIH